MNQKSPALGLAQRFLGLPHFYAEKWPSHRSRAQKGQNGQKGFTLIEVLVVLAIAGVALAGVLVFQANAESRNRANDTIAALTSMVSDVRTAFRPANRYSGVSEAALVQAGVVDSPFAASGTAILDPWGNDTVAVGGSVPFFGISFQVPDRETCMRVVAALAPSADRITVHTTAQSFTGTATTAEGFMTAGTVVKVNATSAYDPAQAALGCAAATTFVGFAFR